VESSKNVAVVIPCFRVKQQILDVLARIGPECRTIYVVDDACPDGSGDLVEANCRDPRVKVLRHDENRGVGAATLTGYRAAIDERADVIVRLDGDGQMDPVLIPQLLRPIFAGEADYTKGNRFFDLERLKPMPWLRLIGNSLLSFAAKLSSGYWNVYDPNNGFTAIDAKVAKALPLSKLSHRWFFESDILFRLGTIRAVVGDIPMPAVYGDEKSSLRIGRIILPFTYWHLVNTLKRIFYGYFLRDFSFASIQLILGVPLLVFGTVFGGRHWLASIEAGVPATSGTVMVAALPVVIGMQFVLSFLSFDMQHVPREVLHKRLRPELD